MFIKSIIFLILVSNINIYSQCCSPGGPTIGSLSPGTVWENNLKIATYYQYGISGKYKEGSEISDFDLLKEGNYNFVGLLLAYGISTELTLSIETGYYVNKTQEYSFGGSLDGFGFTEINLIPKYQIFNALDNGVDFSLGLGAKIPLGTTFQEVDKVLLSVDVQPSMNAYGFITELYLNYPISDYDLQLFWVNRLNINASSKYAGVDYLSGIRNTSSLNILYSINDNFGLHTQLKHEFKDSDKRDTQAVDATSYHIIYLSPQIIYLFDEYVQSTVLFDYPIYSNYNGIQLANDYKISLSLTYNINL